MRVDADGVNYSYTGYYAGEEPARSTDEFAGIIRTSQEEAQGETEDRICAICREQFKDQPEVPVVKTPCGHFFHKRCLTTWLNEKRICPECRAVFQLKNACIVS